MPEEITPSDGQEVNNTPEPDQQQSGNSPEQPEGTEQESPDPKTDNTPPPDETNTSEADAKKQSRIEQLLAAGFIEKDGIYTKPGEFGERINDSDILSVPDETWDAELKKLEDEETDEPDEEIEPEEIKHPEFDYTGKIRLSATDFDAVDIKMANKAIKNSDVTQHDKEVLLGQIKDGKLEYAYAEMLRMILSADRQGQRYSGHL